ncbi:MAG TPA: hypothetical protein VIK72_09590 [Clostridiaceae bacterium]
MEAEYDLSETKLLIEAKDLNIASFKAMMARGGDFNIFSLLKMVRTTGMAF